MIAKRIFSNINKGRDKEQDKPRYNPDSNKEEGDYRESLERRTGKERPEHDYKEFMNEEEKNNFNKINLKDLYNKTLSILPSDPRISLTHEPGKLELILDKKQGFKGYEDFSIKDCKDLFDIKYRGLIENALQTFSENSDYFNSINDSKVLSSFLESIKNTKSNDEGYTSLILLRADGDNNEAKATIDFFSKAFKEKLSS